MNRFTVIVAVLAATASPSSAAASAPDIGPVREAYVRRDTTAARAVIAADSTICAATIAKDTAALRRVYAPEFVLVNPRGEIWTRDRNLAFIASPERSFRALGCDRYNVELYGRSAIVRHRSGLIDTTTGAYIRESSAMHLLAEQDGRWLIVATHEGPPSLRRTYSDTHRDSADAAAVASVAQAIFHASHTADTAVLARHYSDNYVMIGHDGSAQTRSERSRAVAAGPSHAAVARLTPTQVRVYGDVAVLFGRTEAWDIDPVREANLRHDSPPPAREPQRRYAVFQVYERGNGVWKLAMVQASLISGVPRER